MAEQIKVPGIGPVKQEYVWAGGALVAGIVGYAWWKRGSGSDEPAPVDPSMIPETERTPVVGDSTGDFDTNDPDAINTNAEWTRAATEYLTGAGWESGFVATALGRWLAGQGLTEKEVAVVLAAKAAFGEPPVGGPFPVKTGLPNPNPNPTPHVIPKPPLVAPSGFRVTGQHVITGGDRARVDLVWDPVAGATGYRLTASGAADQDSQDNTHLYQPLFRGRAYTITVQAVDGTRTGPPAQLTTTTP